jgi:hypothetical protein
MSVAETLEHAVDDHPGDVDARGHEDPGERSRLDIGATMPRTMLKPRWIAAPR